MVADENPVYTVQVREVVAFVLLSGDLYGETRFMGPDRALAGTRGHQRLQKSRPEGYQKEVSLSHDVPGDGFVLRVRGRIDGLMVENGEVVLEEIKTVQGVWDRVADLQHWAQVKFYGFIHGRKEGLENVTLQLTYLELESGEATELRERYTVDSLEIFFQEITAVYLGWVRARHEWCLRRDVSIRALPFPFAHYRAGQRDLAVAAYRTIANGGRLFLEAPTGIGKTISVLFPAVKAMAERKIERIFYLTARTVGRTIAEKAMSDMRSAGLQLRTVTLTAKDKMCVIDGQRCDPQTCPRSRGYYDRNKAAVRAALEHNEITRPVLDEVGRAHQVCPFELSLDVSSWADAVICDYNYVFDPRVYLRRHFGDGGGDFALLVDEAHNLADRAREMFSAELDSEEVREASRAVKQALPKCARALTRLAAAMRKLGKGKRDLVDAVAPEEAMPEPDLYAPAPATDAETPEATVPTKITQHGDGVKSMNALPADVLALVEKALKEAEAWLAKNEPTEFREALLELYFSLHGFRRTAELFDERYVTLVETRNSTRVRLYCLDPSFLLRQALERGKAAVFFSATLTPVEYYRSLLGGEEADKVMKLKSPFPLENLAVLLHDRIRTDYKARGGTMAEVVAAIEALVAARPGNYLVYFPSYQYLKSVLEEFTAKHPELRTVVQRSSMTEAEREEFLATFSTDHTETRVGFAVMGGIFGEGIDLTGDRLIGAVVVGVGLPQLCVERDLIRDHFQTQGGPGFDFAYRFPGMNRVLQAVGRVVRSDTDRGVVLLIDARFAEGRYRRLFPGWWRVKAVRSAPEAGECAKQFWQTPAAEAGQHPNQGIPLRQVRGQPGDS